jgi:hypothetical protein
VVVDGHVPKQGRLTKIIAIYMSILGEFIPVKNAARAKILGYLLAKSENQNGHPIPMSADEMLKDAVGRANGVAITSLPVNKFMHHRLLAGRCELFPFFVLVLFGNLATFRQDVLPRCLPDAFKVRKGKGWLGHHNHLRSVIGAFILSYLIV